MGPEKIETRQANRTHVRWRRRRVGAAGEFTMTVFAVGLIGVLVWTALAAVVLALCGAAGGADHSETMEAELAAIAPADMLQAAEGLPAPAVESP